VVCHECYATLHDAPKTASSKEVVINIMKEADAKNPLVPKGKNKSEKFDWDKNLSSEPVGGHRSTKGKDEKDTKFMDDEHFHAQNEAIMDGGHVRREEFTMPRGKETKGKPDEATKERYAERREAGHAAIDKEIKVDVEAVDPKKVKKQMDPKMKAKLLDRKLPGEASKFPEGRRSSSEERLIDFDGGKPQDYVTEFNFKGAERVKKDYPYQLMKQSSDVPFKIGPSFGSDVRPAGTPVPTTHAGVPIHASGNGRSLADDLGASEAPESKFKVGSIVKSAAFYRGEIADLVYGDEGQVAGAVVETPSGLMTLAIGAIKLADDVDMTEEAKAEMATMQLDPNNPDHKARYLAKTKKAMYRVAAKANIAEALHGKVGSKFIHKGRTCLEIEGAGKFYFKDEDLVRVA
jgi:hypothetical protein